MEEITYKNSTPVPGSDVFDNRELVDGVEVREQDRGFMVYGVFDGKELVSNTRGPRGNKQVLCFARGYSRAKEKYE